MSWESAAKAVLSLRSRCYSERAHAPAVFGCADSGRAGLWGRLSRHDLPQDGLCRIHGWRQRCMQCEFCSKGRRHRLDSQACVCVWRHLSHAHSAGGLRQPSGVCRRGPGPGVMGSGMCSAQLPWSVRQSVWVPPLDSRHPGGQPLKKWPVLALLFFLQSIPTALTLLFFLSPMPCPFSRVVVHISKIYPHVPERKTQDKNISNFHLAVYIDSGRKNSSSGSMSVTVLIQYKTVWCSYKEAFLCSLPHS